jgi:hypothetical protein
MNLTKEQIDEMFDKATSNLEFSGEHYGLIRNWIKCKFRNGCRVTWGSHETLDGSNFTVKELENLALRIAKAAAREVTTNFRREYNTIRLKKEIMGELKK